MSELTKPQFELLVLLAEECGEVTQRCTKILRFGPIGGPGRPHSTTNAQEMEFELGDLLAVAVCMDREGLISWGRVEAYAEMKVRRLYDEGIISVEGTR